MDPSLVSQDCLEAYQNISTEDEAFQFMQDFGTHFYAKMEAGSSRAQTIFASSVRTQVNDYSTEIKQEVFKMTNNKLGLSYENILELKLDNIENLEV